jgi:hypothetical protein
MRDSDYHEKVVHGLELDGIWKLLQECPSKIAIYDRELLVICAHALKNVVNLEQERCGCIVISFLVPIERRVDVATRKTTDVNPHRLAHAMKSCAEFVADLFPRHGVLWMCLEIGEALIEDRLLPVGNRNAIGTRRDPVPQCLHVVDLIFDRQVIEAWRRNSERLRHSRRIARARVGAKRR